MVSVSEVEELNKLKDKGIYKLVGDSCEIHMDGYVVTIDRSSKVEGPSVAIALEEATSQVKAPIVVDVVQAKKPKLIKYKLTDDEV